MATEKRSSYAIESAYATAHMSAGNVKKRDAVNVANEAKAKGAVSDVAAAAADVVAMLSGMKSLAAIKAHRGEPAYLTALTKPEFGGGGKKRRISDMFKPATGTYTVEVRDRLSAADDPRAEVAKLVKMLEDHADRKHNAFADAAIKPIDAHYSDFKAAMEAAKTPEAKAAAIAKFADAYSDVVAGMLEQFAATVETWRRVIADYHPPAPANEDQGSNPLDSGTLMQV